MTVSTLSYGLPVVKIAPTRFWQEDNSRQTLKSMER